MNAEEMNSESRLLEGTITHWFETGSEGVEWIFDEDGEFEDHWQSFNIIGEGDFLRIYGDTGEIIFEGEIHKDTETGKRPRPFSPAFRQQAALGMWIHWVQQGWAPDDWASLFLRKKPLRAEFRKGATPPLSLDSEE